MFKPKRSKTASGEKFDFKFSGFQVTEVPKGWDKLFVSIVSVETGKTITKLNKASVRNGKCQWWESLTESIWLSKYDISKEMEDHLFKLVVSMGSAGSGILGDATINMTGYMDSRSSTLLSLPLKKCSHGTILQVKLVCLTPINQQRGYGPEELDIHDDDFNEDTDTNSNASDATVVRHSSFSRRGPYSSGSQQGELLSAETSFAGSHHSPISADGSIGRGSVSSRNNMKSSLRNPVATHDSPSLQNNPIFTPYSIWDPSRSNHSSFNSREMASEQVRITTLSPLRHTASSTSLLEAAENTIHEIRAKAKMWERNARKLMVDLDILRKDFLGQSTIKETLEMELSAAHTERDNYKKEIEQLHLLVEESKLKHFLASKRPTVGNQLQQELENEIKFQRESNANLAVQLARTQESNLKLVSILQELEETVEKQKIEIENLSDLKLKFIDRENSIRENVEQHRSLAEQLKQKHESEETLLSTIELLEKALQDQKQELESQWSLSSQNLSASETAYKLRLSAKQKEIVYIEQKLSMSESLQKEMELTGVCDCNSIAKIEALEEKVKEFEKDCNELMQENLELSYKLREFQNKCTGENASQSPSQSSEVSEPPVHHIQEERQNELKGDDHLDPLETSKILPELAVQLQVALSLVSKPWYNISSHDNYEFKCSPDRIADFNCKSVVQGQSECLLGAMADLNKLLESKIAECEQALKCNENEINRRSKDVLLAPEKLEYYTSAPNELSGSLQQMENVKKEIGVQVVELSTEPFEESSHIALLEARLLSQEEEIEVLRRHHSEHEIQVSELQEENIMVKERVETLRSESETVSQWLEDLRYEIVVLNNSLDYHISANNILEMKSEELASGKQEIELCLSELEKENVHLSERTSGLEAQLRHVTDERESSWLELEKSKSLSKNLKDKITNLEIESEARELSFKQKLQEMENHWLESQEEYEYLKGAYSRVQKTAEDVIEENSLLQNSNRELKRHNLELHEHCVQLEFQSKESQERFINCSKKVELLEVNLSSMLQEIALKEKQLNLEIEALLLENEKQKEKIISGESLLNQMYEDKILEVERLQREVGYLTEQMSATQDERERIASDAVREASSLRKDNTKLEYALWEAQSRVIRVGEELDTVRTDAEMKVQSLMIEVAASKWSKDILMADHDKISKLLETHKLNEDKRKTLVNNLELKLTVSEYERQRLVEEATGLKIDLEKIGRLTNEVLSLKNELNMMRFEKEKVQAKLELLCREHEELKREKVLLLVKISTFQKEIVELEDCKLNRHALEEKLLRLEGDLAAKEASCARDAELKNELSRIRREKRQCDLIIKQFEVDKNKYLQRTQALEELILLKEETRIHGSKNEMGKHGYQWNQNRRKQDHSIEQEQQNSHTELNQGEGGSGYKFQKVTESDSLNRIQRLESELGDALEVNCMHKVQLKRISVGRNNNYSSLESELSDIQERYLHMNLKYAEVEAQREELVMKLRGMTKNEKRRF